MNTTHTGPQAQEAGISELLALSEKATPGPWAWRNRSGQIEVAAPHGGGTVVMGFVRDGMRNAQPVFGVTLDGEPRGRRGGILRSAKELIAADPDGELNHPDALFMVAAANWFRTNASTSAPPARVVSDADVLAAVRAFRYEASVAPGKAALVSVDSFDAIIAALSTLQSGAEGKDGDRLADLQARIDHVLRWCDGVQNHPNIAYNRELYDTAGKVRAMVDTALQPGQGTEK